MRRGLVIGANAVFGELCGFGVRDDAEARSWRETPALVSSVLLCTGNSSPPAKISS